MILGINPFDQPNVAESKENTNKILDESGDGPLPEGEPALVDGAVEVHGDLAALGSPHRPRRRAHGAAATRSPTTATSR